ncbi:MAG: hypothetical protein KDA68_08855 [Planctomycetaceae bacterium]|nr:hypothetical protein [Planctomycetaceae bacterium]
MNHIATARLHILLARDAPVGLVIRRGPSRQFATFLWHRKRDTFELGQWAKGRIYVERCDLSPDGKYFIYFVLNAKWHTETKGSWTAISLAPWLKALTLYPQGDTWGGGGLWTSNNTFWLSGSCYLPALKESPAFKIDDSLDECVGNPYYYRLKRDGWTCSTHTQAGRKHVYRICKPLEKGWSLEQNYPEWTYELLHDKNCLVIPCPDWQWADLDGDRLVYAERGKLYSARLDREGLTKVTELYDFNPFQFEPIIAPY